jgi:hypothetical protein
MFMLIARLRAWIYVGLCGLSVICASEICARGEIKLIGTARLAGDATDQSGLANLLGGEIPENRLGGISAIDYTGQEDRYLLLADRGPADGATAYRCRFHELKLAVQPERSPAITAELVSTTLLTNEAGRRLVGSIADFEGADPAKWLRFDPEGLRTDRRGRVFISDEYGPSVFGFSTAGKREVVLKVPDRFRVARPSAVPAEEAAGNTTGRQPNAGLEGLAIVPDGSRLYASMQRPLIQDSRPGKAGKRVGTNTRIIEFDLKQGRTRELLYPLDDPANGVSEILAINGHQFLVLERDGRGGAAAASKKIYIIDGAGASDITTRETLPADGIPEGVTAIRKSLFLDLLAPVFGLAGSDFPEKIEGLAFGPDLADGRRLLIVAIDNDFVAEKPILLHAFAIDRDDLPDFGW